MEFNYISEFYVDDEKLGYTVHFPDFSGEFEGYNGYMRPGDVEDLKRLLAGESIDIFVESKDGDYFDCERIGKMPHRDHRHPKRFKRMQRIVIE